MSDAVSRVLNDSIKVFIALAILAVAVIMLYKAPLM